MNVNKIREDFPALHQKIKGKPIIYFDNACMTLKSRQVIDAMNEYYTKYPACHGRSTHKFGDLVTEKYNRAREKLAKFINAKKSKEVIFTRNTTEGLNFIANTLDFNKGDIIITTDKEHNSNLLPCQRLAKTSGIVHKVVKSNNDNTFSLERFQELMSDKVKLVTMVHTSNIDGYTIPAKEIIKIAHDHNALVMLDGAQSTPSQKIDVRKLDVDFFAFSVHKMTGPTGIGVLYGKENLLEQLPQFLVGGDTVKDTTYDTYVIEDIPARFEAGLQNYAGGIGAGVAAEYLMKIGQGNVQKHEYELNKLMTEKLQEFPQVKIIGPQDPKLRSGIVNIIVKDIQAHDVAMLMDESTNIMIRSGAHCVHSWYNANNIPGSARASMYLYNTKEEVETFIENLRKIIKYFSG